MYRGLGPRSVRTLQAAFDAAGDDAREGLVLSDLLNWIGIVRPDATRNAAYLLVGRAQRNGALRNCDGLYRLSPEHGVRARQTRRELAESLVPSSKRICASDVRRGAVEIGWAPPALSELDGADYPPVIGCQIADRVHAATRRGFVHAEGEGRYGTDG